MKSVLFGIAGLVVGAAGMWALNSDTNSVAAEEIPTETPAYLVVLGEIYDREAFINDYVGKLAPIYEQYGGEYIAVGQNWELMEGEGEFKSFVISKWPSMEAGRAFWNSNEYAPLKDARIENSWGEFDVYLLEGLPAPVSASPAKQ